MVCGDKFRLWLKMALLCIGFIVLTVGIFAGCGDPEVVDVIEQEKDLSDNETDDTAQVLPQETDDDAQVLIQDADGSTHVQVYFKETNLSFYYPSSLSDGISAEIMPGHWLYCPEYKLISFDNYLPSDTALFWARIELTSLEELLLKCDWAEEDINYLKTFIANKDIPDNMQVPHYLPEGNAMQLLSVNVEFFETETVSGFRYITEFVQDRATVTDLTYAYQGITSDQKYYITARFGVHCSELTRHNEDYLEYTGIDLNDRQSWLEAYDDYMDLTIQMLEETDAKNFKPSLILLDEIIKSFQIE